MKEKSHILFSNLSNSEDDIDDPVKSVYDRSKTGPHFAYLDLSVRLLKFLKSQDRVSIEEDRSEVADENIFDRNHCRMSTNVKLIINAKTLESSNTDGLIQVMEPEINKNLSNLNKNLEVKRFPNSLNCLNFKSLTLF